MGFFDDVWNGIKDAANWTYNTAKDVLPIAKEVAPYVLPLIAKKGGEMTQDTPANRKKILNAWNKLHPHHKMSEAKMKKYMLHKKKGGMVKRK